MATSAIHDADSPLIVARNAVPPLTFHSHKGQAGRILVVGGCKEYTGAPYYAGMSALRCGAELCHILCATQAATAIKAYSPELIVVPSLDSDPSSLEQELNTWLQRIHCLLIGPGLGRDSGHLEAAAAAIRAARPLNLPIVIDADGLHLVIQMPELISGYRKTILTPNVVEFRRLYNRLFQTDKIVDEEAAVRNVSSHLGNVTVVKKGPSDVICSGGRVFMCREPGSPRRCGGQGDILSGTMAAFAHWTWTYSSAPIDDVSPGIAAAYAACAITRRAAKLAYTARGRAARGTLSTDILEQVPVAFSSLIAEAPAL